MYRSKEANSLLRKACFFSQSCALVCISNVIKQEASFSQGLLESTQYAVLYTAWYAARVSTFMCVTCRPCRIFSAQSMTSMTERAKNTASRDDLAKVFRAVGMKGVNKEDVTLQCEEFAQKHEELILDILRQTKRPLEKMMALALRDATDNMATVDLANKFARCICDVVEHCRAKKKHMTSGARLPKCMQAIVAQLDKPSDLAAKAEQVAQRLDAPLPVRSSSRSSMDQDAVATDIVDSYKLSSLPSSSKAAKRKVETIELESSQELPPAKESPAKKPPPAKEAPPAKGAVGRAWIDTHKKTVAQVSSDGAIKYAKLTAGPDGFAVAHFTGRSPGTVTEIPNIIAVETPAVIKKPAAAVGKKPAASPSMKRPAAAVEPSDSEAEGDEGEIEGEADEEELAEHDEEVAPESELAYLREVNSPVFGRCKATYCPKKSYIQHASTEVKSGWKSICNFSESLSNHKLAVNEIMNKLKKPGYGAEQVAADKVRLIGQTSIDVE